MFKTINLLAALTCFANGSFITSFGLANHSNSNNNQNYVFKKQNSANWGDVNLNDFVVPNHYLATHFYGNLPQAINPAQADINYNLTSQKESALALTYGIGLSLDNRYQNYLHKYKLSNNLFSEEIGKGRLFPTNEYTIIDQATNKNWSPWNSATPKWGDWSSYNLTFQNLLNNTSFNFSLNLTDFDTASDFTIANNDANLPSMDNQHIPVGFQPKQISSHITNTAPNDMTALDFSQPLYDKNQNNRPIGHFGTIDAAGFFLNSLTYKFRFHTSQLWGNNLYNDHPLPTQTAHITLSQLDSTIMLPSGSITILPIQWVNTNQYAKFDLSVINSSDYYHNNSMDSLTHFSHGQYLFTEDLVAYYTDATSTQLLINNTSLSVATGSAEGHGLYFNFETYGTSLTGSYNTAIFTNPAYSTTHFNPAQNILDQITKTAINYPSLLPPAINTPSAQKRLLSILNAVNNGVLTPYDLAHSSIKLNSGSNNLVAGNNPATLNLNFYGDTATKSLIITYSKTS